MNGDLQQGLLQDLDMVEKQVIAATMSVTEFKQSSRKTRMKVPTYESVHYLEKPIHNSTMIHIQPGRNSQIDQ